MTRVWLSIAPSGDVYVNAAFVFVRHISDTPMLRARFDVLVFFPSSTPDETVSLMQRLGAHVIKVDRPRSFFMFQRYMAHDVLRAGTPWLAMDAHYIWTKKFDEVMVETVDKWIYSGKLFTLYTWPRPEDRPRPFAGGWVGGHARKVFSMEDAIHHWVHELKQKTHHTVVYGDDELFLRDLYVTKIKDDTFIASNLRDYIKQRFQNYSPEQQAKMTRNAKELDEDFTEPEV